MKTRFSGLKLKEFCILKMLFAFLQEIFLPVLELRTEKRILNIFMYMYNENIWEYAQIAGSVPKSMIIYIEGHSNR